MAHFLGEKIVSLSQDSFSLNEKSSFGEKKNSRIEYAPIEALYLMQEKKMQLFSKAKPISFESMLKKVKKTDTKIETKLSVFSDLRKKGYVLKTALKYGAEFRIYNKGENPRTAHARWVLYTSREHDVLNWHDFTAKNRVAHSSKKNLLLAIVDDEGDILYYEVSWIKI